MKRTSVSLAIAAFFVAGILPVAAVFASAFFREGRFCLDAFEGVLANARQIGLFFDTAVFSSGVVALCMIVGGAMALLVAKTDIPFKGVIKKTSLVPLIVPSHVHAVAWIYLAGSNGPVTNAIGKIHPVAAETFSIYGMGGAVFVTGLHFFPIVFLLVSAGLQTSNRELEDAARLCSKPAAVFRSITLPLVAPHMIVSASIVAILCFSEYGVPSLLRVRVYAVEIMAAFGAFYDPGRAAALSAPIVAVCIVLGLACLKFLSGRSFANSGVRFGPDCFDHRLGAWKPFAVLFVLSVIGLSAVVPVAALLLQAGGTDAFVAAWETAREQIAASVSISLSAATATCFAGFILAYALCRWKGAWKRALEASLVTPFALPASIVAIGMIRIWNRPMTDAIYQSEIILAVAYMGMFAAPAAKIVEANMAQIGTAPEEAALLSGASWPKTMALILVPLCLPGIAVAWFAVYVFSMSELTAGLLLAPPGFETLQTRIYTLMHYGAGKIVAALCLFLIAAVVFPVSLLAWLCSIRDRRWRRS